MKKRTKTARASNSALVFGIKLADASAQPRTFADAMDANRAKFYGGLYDSVFGKATPAAPASPASPSTPLVSVPGPTLGGGTAPAAPAPAASALTTTTSGRSPAQQFGAATAAASGPRVGREQIQFPKAPRATAGSTPSALPAAGLNRYGLNANGQRPALARRSGAPAPALPGGMLAGSAAYDTYGQMGRNLENESLQGVLPPSRDTFKPRPNETPIQQELRMRQQALDYAKRYNQEADQAASGDWWNDTVGSRSFGENVAYPARKAVGQGMSMTSQTLKNQGVRGAGLGNAINAGIGQWGKQLTAPWNAPQPLTSSEQLDYKNLQGILSRGDRSLTPEELTRASGFDQRQRAFEAEQERQNYWDTWSTQAINDSDKAFQTASDVSGMLDRGESFDGVKAEIVKGPGGREQVVTVPVDPILREKMRLNEQAGYNQAPSTMGAISNLSYGMGDAAADAAPGMLALSGVGTAANAARAVNAARAGGAMAGVNTAANSANMFNPAVTLNPAAITTIPGAAGYGGTLVGAATAAPSITDAFASGDAQQQMDAGRSLFNRSLIGGSLGQAGGTLGQAGVSAATSRLPASLTEAFAPAVPATATAPSAGSTAATMAGTLGTPVGVGAAMTYADMARNDSRQQAADQAAQIAPNNRAITEQQQANMPGNLNTDRIPPQFAAAAARVNSGTGTGQVGTPVQGRPDIGQLGVVKTEESADFYNWMDRSGAFRTADDRVGPVEIQAQSAAAAAYNDTLKRTGSQQQAIEAREVAHTQTYVKAYQADQAGEYEKSKEALTQMFTDKAAPEDIQSQAQKTFQHLVQSDPQNAQKAKDHLEWLRGMQTGEPVNNPAAEKTNEQARKTFAAQAAAAAPATPGEQKDPSAFGARLGGFMEQFDALPMEAKAAIGIGIPLAIVGMLMNNSGDEGGGLGGLLFTVLGLGAAGLGAAGSGMLGEGAQQMVGSGMQGVAKLFGADIPKGGVDLSMLLSSDPLAGAGKGVLSGDFDIAGKLKQVDQLKQLTNLPSFMAVPLLRSLDPKNIQTAEQAQLAYNNAMKLRQQLDDPNSSLAQMVNRGQQLVNLKDQAAAGVSKAKEWGSKALSYIPGLGG